MITQINCFNCKESLESFRNTFNCSFILIIIITRAQPYEVLRLQNHTIVYTGIWTTCKLYTFQAQEWCYFILVNWKVLLYDCFYDKSNLSQVNFKIFFYVLIFFTNFPGISVLLLVLRNFGGRLTFFVFLLKLRWNRSLMTFKNNSIIWIEFRMQL